MSLIHKTVTARQLLANRANAAKTTGLRTERGKQQARPGRQAAVAGMRRRVGEPGLKDHPRNVGAQK